MTFFFLLAFAVLVVAVWVGRLDRWDRQRRLESARRRHYAPLMGPSLEDIIRRGM